MNHTCLSTEVRGALLCLILLGSPRLDSTANAEPPTDAETLSTSFRKASKAISPAVVTVRMERGRQGSDAEHDSGSGVVIDAEKGRVLTNDHVIQGAARIRVILADGKIRTPLRIHHDPRSDLALLEIDPKGLIQAQWGDSEILEIGDWVLAVGQPFGFSGTVTAGIVSGLNRGAGLIPYEDLIQTDAAINPGNSGGPLINLKGEIVGITTALRTIRGGYEGVGLAIPSARAKRIAEDLAEYGIVKRSYLGVGIGPVESEAAEKLGRPSAIRVTTVNTGGPADLASVKPGDIILKIDGKEIVGTGALQATVEFAKPGKPLHVELSDEAGNTREVDIVPAERPLHSSAHEPIKEETRETPQS